MTGGPEPTVNAFRYNGGLHTADLVWHLTRRQLHGQPERLQQSSSRLSRDLRTHFHNEGDKFTFFFSSPENYNIIRHFSLLLAGYTSVKSTPCILL